MDPLEYDRTNATNIVNLNLGCIAFLKSVPNSEPRTDPLLKQAFLKAQAAALAHYGVKIEQRFIDVPIIEGRAQVLINGAGPPVVFLNGIGTPGAMWAPLMAQLDGCTQYVIDMPGFGLTSTTATLTHNLRATAVAFLDEAFDALCLDQPIILANSLGSLWSSWFAIDRPSRVAALVHIGCPAIILDSSAPLPMRLLSVRPLGHLMMMLQPPSPGQVKQLSKMVREYPLPQEIADLLLATERLPGFKSTFLALLHCLIRLRGSRPTAALTHDQLTQINKPSLLIFGRNDPMGSAPVGRRVAEALPDAELHIVDGGHTPWIHHTDQIAPLVTKFLTSRVS